MKLLFDELPKKRKDPLHPSARETAKVIASWRWPRGAGKTALAGVDKSLKAYERWVRKLAKFTSKNPRLLRFSRHVLRTLPSPRQATVQAYDKVFRTVARRGDFVANLERLAWSPEGAYWTEYGYDVATEWSGDPQLWDRLLEAMNED